MLLPNYGVFDERRYFEPGDAPALIEVGGALVGLTICEDIWFPGPPASVEAVAGARLIVNASASPYHRGKGAVREAMVWPSARRETGAAFALCNLVGGQDELVFDGHSLVVSADGRGARARRPVRGGAARLRPRSARVAAEPAVDGDRSRCTGLATLRARPGPDGRPDPPRRAARPRSAEVYAALVTGLRDYVAKNGFERVAGRRSRAASTRPSSPWSPPTRSAATASPASSCPLPTPAPRPRPTRARSRRTWAPS